VRGADNGLNFLRFSGAALFRSLLVQPGRRESHEAGAPGCGHLPRKYDEAQGREETAEEERERPEKKEISRTAEQLQGYAGDYWSGELGVTYRLAIADGKLKVAGILDGGGSVHTSSLTPDGFGPLVKMI